MNKNQMSELVTCITEHVTGNGGTRGCAPVTLNIGYISTSNMVKHDGIVITDAPAVIINFVVDWASKQNDANGGIVLAEASHGGLFVR